LQHEVRLRLKRTLVSIVCLIGGQVLVPAAAVIPTPRVYLNVAAVKKLVVEFLTNTRSYGERVVIGLEKQYDPQKLYCRPSILL
jgi:hypothetical protein